MSFNSLMHDRNIYKERPDFAKIAQDYPEFRKYALADAKGRVRVDFNNPDALRTVTKILLKKDFGLSVEIPKGFLIPTVPQRLNYILWIEDLLTVLPNANKITHGIDIGCGPCAIFSILGAKKNGWKFTSTETSAEAIQWAQTNIKTNELNALIKVVKVSPEYTLKELLVTNEEVYDFCLCNPPFFETLEEIRNKNDRVKEKLAMIAKHEEIRADGGEVAFVKKIIDESFKFKDRVRLFTSMFGKKKSFAEILKIFQDTKGISFTKSQFCQGNTVRWSLAWTYSKDVCFEKIEKPKPKKPKKAKAPLVHQIPKSMEGVQYNVQELSKIIWKILNDLEILIKVVRNHENYTESQITTDKNTWSHQRRRRRELQRTSDIDHNSLISTDKTEQLSNSINDEMADNITSSECKISNSLSKIIKSEVQDCSVSVSESKRLITETECCLEKNHITVGSSSSPDCNCPISLEAPGSSKSSSQEKDPSETSDCNLKAFTSASPVTMKLESLKIEENCSVAADEIKKDSNTCSETQSKKRKMSEDDSKPPSKCKMSEDASKSPKKRKISEDESKSPEESMMSRDESESPKSLKMSEGESESPKSLKMSEGESESPKKHCSSSQNPNVLKNTEDAKILGQEKSKKDSKRCMKKKIDLKLANEQDVVFEPKSLLFSTLKVRKAKEVVLMEMSCSPEANHESMYQILQYLKNKLR